MTGQADGNKDAQQLCAEAQEFLRAGNAARAIAAFQAALNLDGSIAGAWLGLGRALERQNRGREAVGAFERAVRSEPNNWRALHDYGRALLKTDQTDRAVKALTKAVTINPGSEAVWCDLGTAQLITGALEDAEYSLRYSIFLNGKFAIAFNNLGNCMREQGRTVEAVRAYNRALAADPDLSSAAAARASTQSDMGNVKDALAGLDAFLREHPSDVDCHQTKSLILMRDSQLADGFKEYEWRLSPTRTSVPLRPFTHTRWQPGLGSGKTVLIWLEQGVGDEILSLGLLPDFLSDPGLANAKKILIECDERLARLIERSFPSVTAVPRDNPPNALAMRADLSCAIWKGGLLYRTDFGAFPHHNGYLRPDPKRVSDLRERYRALADGKPVVGLSWSSGGVRGRAKTPPLDAWKPLLMRQDLQFVSVQYAAAGSDIDFLSAMAANPLYVDKDIDQAMDLDQTAAQLSALSATVTVSNTIAHIAGAVGAPVATVVPKGYGGFWYWFRDRKDSPWYPSMRLCRQSSPADWPSAMDNAASWIDSSPWLTNPLPSSEA